METKICSKCGRELPLECFSKDKRSKTGLCSQCKECQKQCYQAHRDEIVFRNKQRYQENKETFLERGKRYRLKNRDKILEKKKIYMKLHNETKQGRAHWLDQNYKKSDKKYIRENNINSQWIVDNIFTSKCVYCGESDWKKLGCDRKDNSIGHVIDNVVCSCMKCNRKRGKKSFEEFLNKKENELDLIL